MEPILAFIGCFLKAKSSLLIGGFSGGIVRSIVSKSGTRWEKVVGGMAGAILSVYFTPIAIALLGTTIPISSLSFVVGLVGMSLVEAIIKIGRDYGNHPGKLKGDIREIILRLLGADKVDKP